MSRHLLAVLADPHLSGRRAYAVPGWGACVAAVRSLGPALIVALGDHVLDDPDDAEDQRYARAALDALGPDHVAVPGNHDVGDNGDQPYLGQAVDSVRLARWRAMHGADRFSRAVGDWWLVGVNSLLLGTGLPEEEEQARWLEEALRGAAGRPVALFTHKPLFWRGPDDADGQNHWPVACRDRLRRALAVERLALVVSGHLHQHRSVVAEGVTHLWCPSTALPGRDHGFGAVTSRGPGFTLIEFDGDRASFAVVPTGVTPPDVAGMQAVHGPARQWPLLSEETPEAVIPGLAV